MEQTDGGEIRRKLVARGNAMFKVKLYCTETEEVRLPSNDTMSDDKLDSE